MPDIRPEPGGRAMPGPGPRPEPRDNREPKGPPPAHHGDVPPHVFKELLELREKIGRLEGMMEVFMKTKL